MSTTPHPLIEDAAEDLAKLERYLEGRLADVRAQRGKQVQPSGQQEIRASETVNVRIHPDKKEVTLTW